MRRSACLTALLCSLAIGASLAHSQEATERFIPIGQSPGQSGRATYIGPIQAVDPAQRVLIVGTAGAAQKFTVTDRTAIWVDRSALKQTNTRGSFADLQPGRRVEVKWDAKDRSRAEWIKVEAAP
ncbi:MAG TPA: hypothetical protein VNK91_13680 [Burkholderiaceae bacterium]|nr:hypothetical protein [Burkholderiaceae bacterium]